MDIVIKILNFFHSSSLNHHEFVALLEEVESEYGEIIYPSKVKWLISGSVLEESFWFVKLDQIIHGKEGQKHWRIEWKRVDNLPSIPCGCDCSLNDLNRELKVKINSLPSCRTIWSPVKWSSDCITLFTFHTWKLLTLFILSVFMNIPSPFFCCVNSLANDSSTSKLWNKNFCCLRLNADM